MYFCDEVSHITSIVTGAEDMCSHHQHLPPDPGRLPEDGGSSHLPHTQGREGSVDGGWQSVQSAVGDVPAEVS